MDSSYGKNINLTQLFKKKKGKWPYNDFQFPTDLATLRLRRISLNIKPEFLRKNAWFILNVRACLACIPV